MKGREPLDGNKSPQMQFLSSQQNKNEINFDEMDFENKNNFVVMIEEMTQTFTTMRDIKRKEAIQLMQKLVNKATFCRRYSEAAYDAVQRFKALVCKKYELQESIRQTRNSGQKSATADAELLKLEEFHLRVTQMAEQTKE